MTDQTTGRGTTDAAATQANITYGVMPEQVLKQLQQEGGEFVVIQRTRQSEQPRIWASGDPTQTKDLFRHGYDVVTAELQPAG